MWGYWLRGREETKMAAPFSLNYRIPSFSIVCRHFYLAVIGTCPSVMLEASDVRFSNE